MASPEFIQKRIAGKQKEIEQLERKIARINDAKATNWTKNPYYYNERDLTYAERDLERANAALADLEADLTTATEKANSRNNEAILEFLNMWKIRVRTAYMKLFDKYYAERDEVYNLYRKADAWKRDTEEYKAYKEADSAFYAKCHGYYERSERGYKRKVASGEYEGIMQYVERGNNRADAEALLDKELNAEADRKYDFIIERTNAICGEIVDASDLRVSENGELNGIIIGSRGNAKVTTIGAGGYNIQCFHFRVLVHKVN